MIACARVQRAVRRLACLAFCLAGLPVASSADSGNPSDPHDQALVGLHHRSRLSRFSFYGDVGFGTVREGNGVLPSSGRLAFDLGVLYDLKGPWRIGGALNHFRFDQDIGGANLPREVNDLTAFLRVDARDDKVLPYAQLGGGIYFTGEGVRSDLFRAAVGLEIPIRRNLFRLEGRYTSYANGVFCCGTESGRHQSLGVVLGIRFTLGRDSKEAVPSREAFFNRLRTTTRYVATEPERRELDAIDDPDQLVYYIEEFWKRRDPYPELEGNVEREEHTMRVAIAASQFAEAGREGWETERGRIMIVHGQPHEVVTEYTYPRSVVRDPTSAGVARDTSSSTSLELWIYYEALPFTDGGQSFFLFQEDAVSRYQEIWTNVAGEYSHGRPLPPLPDTIATNIASGI